MSSNQKPVPQAPPQQARCYQPQHPFPYQFTNKHVKIGADGGYQVQTPPANFIPQQGPQQQIPMRASGMPPTVPPNQSSTPPQQTDGMKVSQIQSQTANIHMTYLPGGMRGNPNHPFFRQPLQPPNRNPSHHRQPTQQMYSQMPAQMFTQVPVPSVVLPNQMAYQQQYHPRTPGQIIHMYNPQMPNLQQSYSNFSNPPSQFYFPGAQPINILSRGPTQVPASTGPQGPNQPPVAMPNIPPPHQIPQQPISKKTNRKFALRIIDPSTGEDKSNEIYGADDFPPPDSGDSSARQTPQPEIHMEAPPTEYTKITMQRPDAILTEADDRRDMPLPDGLAEVEEMMETDFALKSKLLQKKLNIVSASESKLQAGTKEFIPVDAIKNLPLAPPRETPVVSASAGVEVIVCNKSSKERESPAKSRKARENAQRINNESNIQRDLNLVQSVPSLLENEAARDIPLQLPNATMSQPIIIDKQIPIEINQSDASASSAPPVNIILKEHVPIPIHQLPPHPQIPIHQLPPQMQMPPPQIPQQIPQHQPIVITHPKDVINSNKEVLVLHPDPASKAGKQTNKPKPAIDPKYAEAGKNPVPNSAFVVPQVDTHGNKNKTTTTTDKTKSISSKDTPKETPPSTTSAPVITPKPTPPPTQTAAVPTPAPPAAGPTVPIPVSQPPKASNKANKMRELNRKGADKEGTDMDAFNTNDNIANNELNVNNNTTTPTTDNKASVQVTQNLKTGIEANDINKSDNKSLPSSKQRDVCSIVKDIPIPKHIPIKSPATSEVQVSNKDNVLDNKLSNDPDKLVQAKNEANAKASMVNNLNNNNNSSIEAKSTTAVSVLPYKDEQWSPWNPTGKKIYDRDFLFALQKDPKCNIKPDGILNDIAVAGKDFSKQHSRSADVNRYSSMGRHDALLPQYAKSSQSQRNAPLPNRKSQTGKVGKAGGKTNIVHVSLSLREDVKLNETENAWKPARTAKPGEKLTEEETKTAELYKKVRGVLNKLTPEKSDTLVGQVRQLRIDNCQRLQGVIDLVFEKAVDEPNYAIAYARMCRELALMQVPSGNNDHSPGEEPEYVNFRKLLITRCQLEFEKKYVDEEARNKKVKEIEKCTVPEKKKELILLLEEDDRRDRLKSVGNVKFIGELFKEQMLTANIMVRCLQNLIDKIEEENLECLCKLLITIGKDLEVTKKINLDSFFDKMQNIVDTKRNKISSRVRFMLQDVIELRCNKWVPRRTDLKPTTMKQVQTEADNEQMHSQMLNSQPMPRKDDRNMGSDRKRSRNQTQEDGWVTHTQSRNRATPFVVESSKFKNTKPTNLDEEKLGSSSAFAKWNRGSTTHQTVLTNPFSALELVSADNDRRHGPGARNGSRDPYSSKGPSMERSFKSYDDNRGSRSGSQARSRDGSQARQHMMQPMQLPNLSMMPPPKPATTPAPETKAEEFDIEKSSLIILNYYTEEPNVALTAEALENTIPESELGKFVNACYMHTLEKNTTMRTTTGKLIAALCKNGNLSISAVCEGLQLVFDLIDDFIIDIPKIHEYVAEFISPLLAEGVLTLKLLKQTLCDSELVNLQPSDENYPGNSPGKLLVHIFNILKKEKGPSFLRSLWVDSGVTFSDFVPSNKVNDFIKVNQLEFISSGSTTVPTSTGVVSSAEVSAKLLEFFESNAEFNDITLWVAANVGDQAASNKGFIRALVTALCNYSIKDKKLDENRFNKYFQMILRYADLKPECELQVLYTLQAYVSQLEHPAGLVLDICNSLWDNAIISIEGFLQWESCQDPAEQAGKGVVLKSLTSFFTALREVEECSSTSENEAESDHGGIGG